MIFDKEFKSEFSMLFKCGKIYIYIFFFFLGGGGPHLLQIFINIFWHNHIIIFNSIERFFQFHALVLVEMDSNLTGLFLFNFETTPCKNHSDTNLIKIH